MLAAMEDNEKQCNNAGFWILSTRFSFGFVLTVHKFIIYHTKKSDILSMMLRNATHL